MGLPDTTATAMTPSDSVSIRLRDTPLRASDEVTRGDYPSLGRAMEALKDAVRGEGWQ